VAEQRIESLYRRLQDLLAQLNNVRQQLRMAFAGGGGGGSSSVAVPYFFTPSGSLAGPASVGSGSPAVLSGQTLYVISSGAWSAAGTGDVYNGLASTLQAGFGAIAIQNSDGTFTAISQSCV
jgi:hypothetical protein